MTLLSSVLTRPAQLEALRPEWAALLRRSGAARPMLAPAWLLAWWHVYGARDGRALRVVALRDGDRLVGLAPLQARRHWYPPALPFRRLELLGTGEPEADEACSEYLDVVAERGAEREVTDHLAGVLATGAAGAWDELVMPSLDGSSPVPALLTEALRRRGLPALIEETGCSRFIALPASWGGYLETLPSASRYLVTRSLRDFEAWAQGETRVMRARSPAELARGSLLLRALHSERWAGEGSFASPLFDAFHARVTPALFADGALELCWLTVRGEPVAITYNLRSGGTEYFYQCGRTLDLPRGLRPGIVMHAHAIRGAIEAGLSEYDFLGGKQQYKHQLASGCRPFVQVRAARPSLLEVARVASRRGLAGARRLRRSIDHALEQLPRRPGAPPGLDP